MNLPWERWRLAGAFVIVAQQLTGETSALPGSWPRFTSIRRRCSLSMSLPALRSLNGSTEVRILSESQRDSGSKPRVARNELPWGMASSGYNPERVAAPCDGSRRCGCNPVGVVHPITDQPRVARSSQPWAGRRNPVGIEGPCKGQRELAPSRYRDKAYSEHHSQVKLGFRITRPSEGSWSLWYRKAELHEAHSASEAHSNHHSQVKLGTRVTRPSKAAGPARRPLTLSTLLTI